MHPQVIKLSKEIEALKAEGDALLSATEFTDATQERLDAITAQVEANRSKIATIEAAREAMRSNPGPYLQTTDELDKKAAAGVLFGSLGEQLQAVVAAAANPSAPDRRLLALNAAALGQQEGVGTDGGWLVQSDYATELLQRVHSMGEVMKRVRRATIGANSNRLQMNRVKETSRATGSRWGGIQVYSPSEASTITASQVAFEPWSLELIKYTGLVYATGEQLQDTTQMESIIGQAITEEFDFKLADHVIRGNGAGQMLGIIPGGSTTSGSATVEVSKETGQAAATVLPENIRKMFARQIARNIPNCVWFINQDVWPALFSLEQSTGTGGVPLFLPPGGISAAPYGMLMGRPIVPIEQCSTLGTVGDIILADMSQYMVIEKGGVRADSSIHVQFLTDQTAFRFILRTNGAPVFPTALTPYKGSATQGDFVVLQTRS